jgi:LysM repeat protein
MMRKISLVIFLLWMTIGCSQSHVKHVVAKGETITQIAQKYKVTPYDIYQLNPDAKSGIQENSVLIIPSKATFKELKKTHTVQSKDTFFSIAKQYNVSVESLEKANPSIDTSALSVGAVLMIPSKNDVDAKPTATNTGVKPVYHIVQPKETKFGIAKQYNTTVENLEKLNPEIISGLPEGYKLIISQQIQVPTSILEEVKTTPDPKVVDKDYFLYEVKPKETLFGLSKNFKLSQEKLIQLNPELKEGVREGMQLKIPVANALKPEKKEITSIIETVASSKKEIALLLPFNISKIASDTTLTTQARLKKDSFLNLTLEFYTGALMAIDSAKQLGLNVNFKIYDSQETRNSSNVANLVKSKNFSDVDAVIGPFYPQYVEKVAELLKEENIPVISPLRETTKSFPNLYVSMPSANQLREGMMHHLKKTNGNIVALIDAKRNATRSYLQANFSEVFIAPFDDKGRVKYDSIQPKLKANVVNYLVLDTGSTSMILQSLALCNEAKAKGFNAELVVLDLNSTFETDEIFERLVKQKIIFASLTRYQDTPESLQFANAYKKVNNVFPNQYAIRGFDVTFDAILRVLQPEGFEQSSTNVATQYLENKFDYVQRTPAGYENTGVYIMQYQEDYTVLELN